MTIFADAETLCQRDDNHCKKRKKCARHEAPRKDYTWEADYFLAYAQYCPYFVGVKDAERS